MDYKVYKKQVNDFPQWCADVTPLFLEKFGKYFSGLQKVELVLPTYSDKAEHVESVFTKKLSGWMEEYANFDGGRLYLTFSDGITLEFWNSEWGGMKVSAS